ncbi:MAG: FecR domain-containing protein, partial [Acidobacteriota bacterium]|nr:FecR domain-containing protein [Acidobacteriota bacterium]
MLIAILTMVAGLAAVTGALAQVKLSPGVARVSLIDGNVSTQRGDAGEWSAATINTPLATGDKISTGSSSRAEVQLDYADVLRLSGSTEADIANLSSSQIQVQVAQGLVDYSVLQGSDAQAEIDTPNVAVHPLEPGVARRFVRQADVVARRIERENPPAGIARQPDKLPRGRAEQAQSG